ncbi:MAG: phage major capsid protein [Candidatus Nanopelagicales bacterium]
MSEYLKKLVEDRQAAYHAAKAKMDEAAAESRDLSAEEREFVDRTFAELDEKRATIDTLLEAEKREREIAESMRGLEDVVRPVEARTAPAETDADILRSLLAGERRAHSFQFEKRDLAKSTSNAPVPTSFSDVVIDQARLVGPMLDPSVVTILNTAAGEDLVLPSLASWSTAGYEAEAATIDESDPGFGKTTLKAYKYAFIVQVSQEFLADSNIDVIGFLGQQAGNAIGYAVNNKLTVGTGTVEPKGIVAASTLGVTGGTATATAGTGHFTADNLIDLVYSLDGAARRLPGFGVMANGSSIGAMRKLKTSSGDYVFVPSIQPGTPDSILGYPLIENPAMASVGSASKSVLAGHFPSYFVRTVGGIDVARSDDFAFNTGQVTLRFQIRVDGNLPQTSHVRHHLGGTA